MRKVYRLWVLRDRRNRCWQYTNGNIVTFASKNDAQLMAGFLDKKREWKPVCGTLQLPV